MYVIKRDQTQQPVHFDKITERIKTLIGLEPVLTRIDPVAIAQKVVSGIFAGVTTKQLDNLAAETAAYLSTSHPDYESLASRIVISNMHKETEGNLLVIAERMYNYVNPKTKLSGPLISLETFEIIKEFADQLITAIDYSRDYGYSFFGYKTLEKSYLIKIDDQIVERPQDMLMRVAIGIHKRNIEKVIETYELQSKRFYTHATPTLFNAGTNNAQMSSCFLLAMKSDSIEGIYDTLKQTAQISKSAGGIGVSIHNIRASGAYIRGTNGTSNGLIPMLKVFNETARYVDQGGGKRKGAFAMYLEPWHADIEAFLELKKNHGKEELRARDLFYGLWIPNLFMKRVEEESTWSLFCPNEAPGLFEVWGQDFERLYCQYEREGRARKVINAVDLWNLIVTVQIETGLPYCMYKDAVNSKSNQKNLGTIRSSNLCTEIVEYTDENTISVCNLSSLALPMFIKDGIFDHQLLYEATYKVAYSLDCLIDENFYPVIEAKNSNMNHRPIGIGVQGQADLYCMLHLPFDSLEAMKLNKEIFETIYFAAARSSCDTAKIKGAYNSFKGSPASQGMLCPDMWDVVPSDRWDFNQLRKDIIEFGLRNSLLVAPMPTASTSQILGNNECFEPFTTNIYSRRVLAGDFVVINKHLVKDLLELGLWNDKLKDEIVANNGSVQDISSIPDKLKLIYRTVWEMKMKPLVDMAADRAAFIDQSQSFNIFMAQPTKAQVTSLHFYGWKKGLKTGMYYLRTRPSLEANQVTVDKGGKKLDEQVCTMEEGCLQCGS